MRLKRLIKTTFENGNTCVDGLRGRGKDMLFANVIARRKGVYISNVDYHCPNALYMPLKFPLLNVENSYKNIIEDNIKFYDYPYPENSDIYISDCGIIFPSQHYQDIDKRYSYIATFMALSRHMGNSNVHWNVQSLNRVSDKLREMSDIYIKCNSCVVLSNTFLAKIPLIKRLVKDIVIQVVTIYDKYESCLNRVEPFRRIPAPLMGSKEAKAVVNEHNLDRKARYLEQYGTVKRRLLVYRNLSNYDTRYYKSLFLGGKKNEKTI